jgi:hypothetical protein
MPAAATKVLDPCCITLIFLVAVTDPAVPVAVRM